MEKITIEKVIEFDSVIDSIEYINVDDNIKYEIDEDDTHCEATLYIKGKVNTLLGEKEFKEDVDVDIYAPFEKKLDKDDFNIEVKDYSYNINQKKLIVYIILYLHGIKEFKVEEEHDEDEKVLLEEISEDNESSSLVEDINSVNEINEEVRIEKKENTNVKIVEDNVVEEMNKSWASDLFDLTDNYSLFMKFHVD